MPKETIILLLRQQQSMGTKGPFNLPFLKTHGKTAESYFLDNCSLQIHIAKGLGAVEGVLFIFFSFPQAIGFQVPVKHLSHICVITVLNLQIISHDQTWL